ncbi:hypothetical protein D3C73_1151150 [compost metagenome]
MFVRSNAFDGDSILVFASELLHLHFHRIVFKGDNVLDKVLLMLRASLNLIKRVSIIFMRSDCMLLRLPHDISKCVFRTALNANWNRVNKQSDRLLDTRQLFRTSGHNAAEDDVITAVIPLQ